MNHEGLLISEKINEVTKMCDRENPIYEQISNFSIVLYVFDYFKCPDLLCADDLDFTEAGAILKEHFIKIDKDGVPQDYNIFESGGKYLLVLGDPLFPAHFAVIVDMKSPRPYFSKLPFFGSGFDSLDELKKEFLGKDGAGHDEIAYYKMKSVSSAKKNAGAKIYTIKNDDVITHYAFNQHTNKRRNISVGHSGCNIKS